MKKIKVAIPLIKNTSWLGGYNYLINLLEALDQIPDPRIEIVLFGPSCLKGEIVNKFPKFDYINTSLFTPLGILYWGTKFIGKYLGKYKLHEFLLNFLGISVLAYSSPLGKSNLVASICWIPDFQHIYLTDFFSRSEVLKRNKIFRAYIEKSTIVLLSSNSSKKDLEKFTARVIKNARILRFASCNSLKSEILSFNKIQEKYNIPNLYFHVPNQFWQHKNHRIVAEAVQILNKKNMHINIVCTGKTNDYRNPEYFSKFLELLKTLEVESQFKILGIIPYKEMISLMYYSAAVINPSMFEGWSTTVEESKILNKSILLSDIPVHKEQNPKKASFFNLSSPVELAEKIEQCVENYSVESNCLSKQLNSKLYDEDILEFALNFENISLEAFKMINSK